MTDKPTPQDFIEAANVLQDVASRDKLQADIKTQGMDMIPKLSNYVVAKGLTTDELSVAVNKRLDRGWITIGGVSSAVETIPVEAEKGLFPKRPESKTKEVTIYIQAMGMPSKNI